METELPSPRGATRRGATRSLRACSSRPPVASVPSRRSPAGRASKPSSRFPFLRRPRGTCSFSFPLNLLQHTAARYSYEYEPSRPPVEIKADIRKGEMGIVRMLGQVTGGADLADDSGDHRAASLTPAGLAGTQEDSTMGNPTPDRTGRGGPEVRSAGIPGSPPQRPRRRRTSSGFIRQGIDDVRSAARRGVEAINLCYLQWAQLGGSSEPVRPPARLSPPARTGTPVRNPPRSATPPSPSRD